MSANKQTVRQYLAAISRFAPAEEVERFVHDDVEFEELPNRFSPRGSQRDKRTLLSSVGLGKKLLQKQSFEIRRVFEDEDLVAVEVDWRGTLAVPFYSLPAGAELRARSAMFFELRDGRIFRQKNYDCVDPW
jgi:ketosteroid isomerase-like protein